MPALLESLFEQIITKLIAVLEHSQQSGNTVTPESKQALLQAVRRLAPTHTSGIMSPRRIADQRLQENAFAGKGLCCAFTWWRAERQGAEGADRDARTAARAQEVGAFPPRSFPVFIWMHRQQLAKFSECVSSVLSTPGQSDMVEIDLTASTPVGSYSPARNT